MTTAAARALHTSGRWMGSECGGMISLCLCVSAPFVLDCVGEVYYMVLVCSFCDVVLQTELYSSTATHSSTVGKWCELKYIVITQHSRYISSN